MRPRDYPRGSGCASSPGLQMTITLSVWWLVVVLLAFPFVYLFLFRREPGGNFDFHLDTIAVFAVCWSVDLGLFIGLLVSP